MKQILAGIILILTCTGCQIPRTIRSGPVQTEVALQLTKAVTQTPSQLPLPPIWTLRPPAVNAPTRKPTAPEQPTITVFTLVPLATKAVKKTSAPDEASITYKLSGTAEQVEITYVKPDGSVVSDEYPLPFETTLNFKKGAPVSMFGKVVSDFGTITCQVVSSGKILTEGTATGTGKMAFCSDITAE